MQCNVSIMISPPLVTYNTVLMLFPSVYHIYLNNIVVIISFVQLYILFNINMYQSHFLEQNS